MNLRPARGLVVQSAVARSELIRTRGAITLARSDTRTTGGYVDIYLLPIPARNVAAYREQATLFGSVAREYGALRYREFRADDVGESMHVGALVAHDLRQALGGSAQPTITVRATDGTGPRSVLRSTNSM